LIDFNYFNLKKKVQLEHEILLHPRYFGPELLHTVKQKLFSEVEGTCSGKYVYCFKIFEGINIFNILTVIFRYGFIVAITSIENIGSGMIQSGRGYCSYPVKYKAIVFRPFKNEVVDAVVSQVTKVWTIDLVLSNNFTK
jgi:DNA-directed RNA polymerase II subunit RPB7